MVTQHNYRGFTIKGSYIADMSGLKVLSTAEVQLNNNMNFRMSTRIIGDNYEKTQAYQCKIMQNLVDYYVKYLDTGREQIKNRLEREAADIDPFYVECINNPRYYWDLWFIDALDRGVSFDLAVLGREIMREDYQHQWEGLSVEVGPVAWEKMIEQALNDPSTVEKRWSHLMKTDGLRI
jgi:hypothetical protein